MPQWVNDAIFYEIYPPSFYDSNGDGIGDINGVIEKLDYIQSLGCNAVWMNACFDSPFKDGGYDIRDYKKVAPRYGTNDDLVRCFAEAHRRGMHFLLDLVPCHTSEEHAWFQKSLEPDPNEYSHRYIWTNHCFERPGQLPCVGGESDRNGLYVISFFKSQPALNYGFLKPEKPWQLPMDHPACLATRAAMQDVMRFWLDKGCDGFRVDMARWLVHGDDEQFSGAAAIWREFRAMMDAEYPEAALMAEWGCPEQALKAGFHLDLYIHRDGNAYSRLMRAFAGTMDGAVHGEDNSYFCKTSKASIVPFLQEYLPQYESTKDDGLICWITGNHDVMRPRGNLSPAELKLAYAFLFTMPGVPQIYYGDEIGMRYLNVRSKEGGYYRTGSRTPMQWNGGANLGFSAAGAESIYLPADPAPDAPTVAAEEEDPHSLLRTVRALLRLRQNTPQLRGNAPFAVYFAEENSRLFVFRRGTLYIAVNPGTQSCTFRAPDAGEILLQIGGCTAEAGAVTLAPQSFAVLRGQ